MITAVDYQNITSNSFTGLVKDKATVIGSATFMRYPNCCAGLFMFHIGVDDREDFYQYLRRAFTLPVGRRFVIAVTAHYQVNAEQVFDRLASHRILLDPSWSNEGSKLTVWVLPAWTVDGEETRAPFSHDLAERFANLEAPVSPRTLQVSTMPGCCAASFISCFPGTNWVTDSEMENILMNVESKMRNSSRRWFMFVTNEYQHRFTSLLTDNFETRTIDLPKTYSNENNMISINVVKNPALED